jgi:cell division transport system permease protein
MRYVGATDFYIKMPFILEGMLQGMIGGLLAIAGLILVKLVLAPMQLHWGLWLGPRFLFFVIFCIGVLFGWIGSMSAVRKFLL